MSEQNKFRFIPTISELPATVPFVGPEEQQRQTGIMFRARLGANESGFGPSPLATKAMQDAAHSTWQYADPDNHELRQALANHYGVGFENVMVGEGIDGLLGYLAYMFVEPGVPVVTSLGSYPTFNYHVNMRGCVLHQVPYKNDYEDREALLSKVEETDAALLYFSNPNNPMGTYWSAEEMQEMIDRLPARTILALDEAYIETAAEGIAPAIDVSRPNVLRFRTFSKLYGMAGARIGYVIGHCELVSAFNKVRNHYGVNLVAQEGALAALADQAYLGEVKGRIEQGRQRIADIAAAHGMKVLPSGTNFVTIDCGRDTAYAKLLLSELLARGIFVRMPGVEPQSRCIRISVGLPGELDLFEKEFAEIIAQAG